MTHHCHAVACKTPCKPELLMCGRHWARVSKATQRLVWRHYRAGQCDDRQPSAEWHEAANRAIVEVAIIEGHTLVGPLARLARKMIDEMRATLPDEQGAVEATNAQGEKIKVVL